MNATTIYSPFQTTAAVNSQPEEIRFLGDLNFKISDTTDLTKVVVKLIPFQKESSYSGDPIILPLSILEPWPSLFHPFLFFDASTSGVLNIETNSETLSVLVEFLKAWSSIPSAKLKERAFDVLNEYLDTNIAIEHHNEKEKEKEDTKKEEFSHPFNKVLELYLLANYLNIEEVVNFSMTFIQSNKFLETINEEVFSDLIQRIGNTFMPDEFQFTWHVLFLRACQAKNFDHAKLLLDLYLKKNQLDDLRNSIQKPHFPEEVLPFLIKMILNVEDKTTAEFDNRFNFAISLMEDYYSQIFYSQEHSLANTSFFYSLFAIATEVQTAKQGNKLLNFFIYNPSKNLTPTPLLSSEEKLFLENNNIYVSNLKYRESVIAIIIFQEISRALLMKNKPTEILIVLRKFCKLIQSRDNEASLLEIVRSIFIVSLMNSSSVLNYLKNLDLLFMLKKTLKQWLPSYTGKPKEIFNSAFFRKRYPNLKCLREEDILRIEARIEDAKNNLDLYKPLIKAIKNNKKLLILFNKEEYFNKLNSLFHLFGLINALPQNHHAILELISLGNLDKAIALFENEEVDIEKFCSIALQSLDIEKLFNFSINISPSARNFFLGKFWKFLIDHKKWDDFSICRQKIKLHKNNDLQLDFIDYLIHHLKNSNKQDIDECIQILQILLEELNSMSFISKNYETFVSNNLFKIVDNFLKTKDKKSLNKIENLLNQFNTIKIFEKRHLEKFRNRALAARFLLGEGREVIEELKGVKAKCACLDKLGAVVSSIRPSALPMESTQALLSFAFHPKVIAEIKNKPRSSAEILYPFLLKICSRFAYIYKIQDSEIHEKMNEYIQIILSLGHLHSPIEYFNYSGDIEQLLSLKSTMSDEDFTSLLLKTGKFLAKMKNEQLFLELAKKCDQSDFQTLSQAYFLTNRRLTNPEESQNATACPASFFDALIMSRMFPIQGINEVRKKRKLEIDPPSLDKEKEKE